MIDCDCQWVNLWRRSQRPTSQIYTCCKINMEDGTQDSAGFGRWFWTSKVVVVTAWDNIINKSGCFFSKIWVLMWVLFLQSWHNTGPVFGWPSVAPSSAHRPAPLLPGHSGRDTWKLLRAGDGNGWQLPFFLIRFILRWVFFCFKHLVPTPINKPWFIN